MPRKHVMTWQEDKQRWRKIHKGKLYHVTPKELGGRTKEDTWQAANAWWDGMLKKLGGEPPSAPRLDPLSALLGQLLQTVGGTAALDRKEAIGKAAAALSQILNVATVNDATPIEQRLLEGPPLPKQVPAILLGKPGEPLTEEVTLTKLTELSATVAGLPCDPDKSVRHHAEAWKALQMGSDKSAARKKMNCHMLSFFTDFLGTVETCAITETKWEEFFLWLRQKSLDDGYKGRILRTARNFVAYLYDKRQLDSLPRNLGNNNLTFREKRKKVMPQPLGTVRAFFAAATGQTRLHVLLMLNCGMTAADVSDLQDRQVNWHAGTITRKRSKTEDHEDVPEVTYRLWPQTLDLLREYRSGGDIVLLTKTGQPWILEQEEGPGQPYKHSDSIASNFKNVCRRAAVKLSPKNLRTTAASMLGEHAQYKFYAQYFLGQSPTTVADKHYVRPSEKEFFKALDWLREQFFPSKG